MFRDKILLSSALVSLLGISVLCISAQATTVVSEPAQGDGDPTEVLPVAVSEQSTEVKTDLNAESDLKQDERIETAEDAVATITAEGDFVVPTYLLPIEPITEKSTVDEEELKIVTTTTETITAPVLSKGISLVSEKKSVVPPLKTQDKFLSEMALDKESTQEDFESVNNKVDEVSEPDQKVLEASKKPLLLPLAPIKELEKDEEGQVDIRPQRRVIPSDYADQVVSALEKNEKVPFIMPQEVKVTFYPNAVEFSGQTVKWIRAFSLVALADPRLMVDVRVSTQNPEIQEKRLPLVKNILLSNGLSPHQIQITYADRPSDTLILRNIIKPEAYEIVEKKGIRTKKTKKW